MKKARTLIIVGSILMLIIGLITLIIDGVALFDIFVLKYPNQSMNTILFYDREYLIATIGFCIFGCLYFIGSIVGFICSSRSLIYRSGTQIMCMIFAFLTLPIGLMLFFGGLTAMKVETKEAQKRGNIKKVKFNKRAFGIFIGLVVVYFIAVFVMYIVNLAPDSVIGPNGPYSFPRLRDEYISVLFGGSFVGNPIATKIGNFSLYVIIPFSIAILYSLFVGCCPAIGERLTLVKYILYGVLFVASAIFYIVFMVEFPGLYEQLKEVGKLAHNEDATLLAAYLMPILYVSAYATLGFVMSYLSKFVVLLVCKIFRKKPTTGFSIIGAFVTLCVFFGGIAYINEVVLVFVNLAIVGLKLIKSAIASLISFFIVFCLFNAALGILPDRLIKVSFSDGSYTIIEQRSSGGRKYGKVQHYDKYGKVHLYDKNYDPKYLDNNDVENLNKELDKNKKLWR